MATKRRKFVVRLSPTTHHTSTQYARQDTIHTSLGQVCIASVGLETGKEASLLRPPRHTVWKNSESLRNHSLFLKIKNYFRAICFYLLDKSYLYNDVYFVEEQTTCT